MDSERSVRWCMYLCVCSSLLRTLHVIPYSVTSPMVPAPLAELSVGSHGCFGPQNAADVLISSGQYTQAEAVLEQLLHSNAIDVYGPVGVQVC